MLFDVG